VRLHLIVLELSDRCDQRCVHCAIWAPRPRRAGVGLDDRLRLVDEALAAGAREALLTGGEPLLAPDFVPVAARLRAAGARVMLCTAGGPLAERAAEVARLVDEVYVSLDGAQPATHDRLRGPRAFARVERGIAALRAQAPRRAGGDRPAIVARSVLHGGNLGEMARLPEAARALGFDHVSFLALDAHSVEAFGGAPEERRALVPTAPQIADFEAALTAMEAAGAWADGFVLESPQALRRIARHLAASAGLAAFTRPRCDAPRWSSVVTADGALKPCFFHPPVDDARRGLVRVRRSAAYRAAVARTEAPNVICERCVCSKWRGPGWRRWLA
jgi:MoaA/NifB/PqqE/SkfB family radical SAM enzyme